MSVQGPAPISDEIAFKNILLMKAIKDEAQKLDSDVQAKIKKSSDIKASLLAMKAKYNVSTKVINSVWAPYAAKKQAEVAEAKQELEAAKVKSAASQTELAEAQREQGEAEAKLNGSLQQLAISLRQDRDRIKNDLKQTNAEIDASRNQSKAGFNQAAGQVYLPGSRPPPLPSVKRPPEKKEAKEAVERKGPPPLPGARVPHV